MTHELHQTTHARPTLTREEAAWLRACAERDQKYTEWQKAAAQASRLGRLAFGDTK